MQENGLKTINYYKGNNIMDIKFEVEGNRFNVRSSCIIKDKEHNKVLLTNMRAITDHDAFLLPGGRLEIFENSEEAIKREIEEELNLKLDYKLISIEENIAKLDKFQMIEFVYYAEIDSFEKMEIPNDGWDKFKVMEIKDIDKIDIRPKTINKLIKCDEYFNISHNVNYDWA